MKQKLGNFLMILTAIGFRKNEKDTSFSISGSVSNNITDEPIPEAAVIIFTNGELISGNITDTNGKFEFKNLSQNCKYVLKVIKLGYYYFQSEEGIFCSENSRRFDVELIKIEN